MHIDSNNLFSQAGLTDTGDQRQFSHHRKIIATIEIDVGEEVAKPLYVRQFEDSYLLAVNFCSRYGLNQKAVDIVERKIEQTIIKYKQYGADEEMQDSLERNKSVSRSHTNNKSKANTKKVATRNKGDRGQGLYEKGLRTIQKVQQQRVKRRIEQEQALGQQATFKPKINPVSEKIVEMRREVGERVREHRLSPVAKIVQQMNPCTFKPEINKMSQRIVRGKNVQREQDRINELYYDSIRQAQKRKQAQQKQQYTYKPQLNKKQNAQITAGFLQRLQQTIAKKKSNEMQSQNAGDRQCSFVPKIGRPPKIDRNKQNLPIGDYLLSQTSSKYLRQSMSSVSVSRTSETTTIRNRKSDSIYNNMLNERIYQVFCMLDSDHDGLISPDHIDIENLSANTLQYLQPLFKQLEEVQAVLDEGMFKKAMLKLLDNSDAFNKGRFLSEKWNKVEEQHFSFAPQINTKSRKILIEKGHSRTSLYQDGLRSKQRLESKILDEKAKKEEKELEECSFRPTLNSNSQIYIRKIGHQKQNGTSPDKRK